MKRENLLILFIFSLLITGMALEKQYPTKQLSFKIDDKCPTNTLVGSRDSLGPIRISIINSYSMCTKRQLFIKSLMKW